MLSRNFLKSLGLSEEQISAVVEAHGETVTALNQKYAELEALYAGAKESAERLPDVQKELDAMRKDDFKAKFEAEKSAHDALKTSVAKKETQAAKEKAVRAFYEARNIRGANLAIAMRGTDLDSLELDEHGRLADTTSLEELVNGDFRTLVASETRRTVTSGAALTGKATPAQSTNEVMNHLLRGN